MHRFLWRPDSSGREIAGIMIGILNFHVLAFTHQSFFKKSGCADNKKTCAVHKTLTIPDTVYIQCSRLVNVGTICTYQVPFFNNQNVMNTEDQQ